ncbi:MAG: hypothetical protein Kow00129_00080 [Thermoleophilia bacterium]
MSKVVNATKDVRERGEAAGRAGNRLAAGDGSPGPGNTSRRLTLVERPRTENGTDLELESLSNEELVVLYQRESCVTCLDVLLTRNENLCHHVLKRFSYSGEPYEDLFQVARVGLIRAAQRFDPSYGTRFSTYAVPVLEGEVRHYLRDCLLVRQPRWAKSLYERIQAFQVEFQKQHRRSPSLSEVAEGVNVQKEGVLELIRFYGSLDLQARQDTLSEEPELDRSRIRSLKQENFTLPIEDRIMLYEAMNALSEAHRRMIYLLFFKELTQQEVAEELGVSQRTVSREQSKALGRLKAILTKKIF